MRKAYTLTSGIIAIGIYLCILGLLFWHFDHEEDKDIGAKNEQIISVDLSKIDGSQDAPSTPSPAARESIDAKAYPLQSLEQPLKEHIEQQQKEEPLPQKLIPIQKKQILADKPKVVVPIEKKQETKKIQDQKPIQKSKDTPKKTSDLFANVKSDAPIVPNTKTKPSPKPSQVTKISKSTSSAASELINKEFGKKGNAGVEDAYKSKVKSILQGWPAQNSYAGERAKISFVIQPNGDFDFKIIRPSANEEFNQGLVQYLKQLQRVGFGSHSGSRAYLFEVDFIAER